MRMHKQKTNTKDTEISENWYAHTAHVYQIILFYYLLSWLSYLACTLWHLIDIILHERAYIVSTEGFESFLDVSVANSHACHQSNSCQWAQLTWDARKSKDACLPSRHTFSHSAEDTLYRGAAVHIPDPCWEALVKLNYGVPVPLHFTHQTDCISHCMSPTGPEKKQVSIYPCYKYNQIPSKEGAWGSY